MTKEITVIIQADERVRVFVAVPFDPKEVWGKQSRFYVTMDINGAAFSTSLGAKGGQYFFPFSKDMQVKTGLAVGDEAAIKISLTAAGKVENELPEGLSAALNKNKMAKDFFEALSGFYKNTYIKWITAAKQDETRTRRIAETVQLLENGKKQK